MDDVTLRALLEARHSASLAAVDATKLSGEGSKAMAYYLGDMSQDLPAEEGRSSAVSMDVADTIEGMMPQIMEVFTGGDEVVKFEPVGPEDVQAAEQETDYVNHVFMNRNPGFMVLYSMVKDALLQKVGVVKIWWEKEERVQRETYTDKTDDEYALIVASPDIEVVEHTEKPNPYAQQQQMQPPQPDAGQQPPQDGAQPGMAADPNQPPQPMNGAPQQMPQPMPQQVGGGMLHDLVVETKKDYSCAKVMPVPPEEFGISRDARTIQDASYCYHKVIKSVSELIEQGYDEEQVRSLPTYRAYSNTEELNRDTVDEHDVSGSDEYDDVSRVVEITEHYCVFDYQDTGRAELHRVTTSGGSAPGSIGDILDLDGKPDIQPFDMMPFAAITPIPQTHRFFGRSVADIVMDIQKIKTALLRGTLDNVYLRNRPRLEVAETLAGPNTLDDAMVSRPGGIIRTKTPGGLNWQVVPDIAGATFPVLEYFDTVREWRTGVTRAGQGIDANALQNQTATAVNQVYTAAQARVRLIARIFAETGIRDMFALLHAVIKKHGDQPQTVRLRNQWVTVDPRNWKTRDDLTVHVGLGSGDKAQRVAQVMQIAGLQQQAMAAGLTNLVNVQNLYNTAKEITKLLGSPDTDTFFTDPKTQPPPEPQPDPQTQKIMGELQIAQQKAQADVQMQQQKAQASLQLDQQKHAADIEANRQQMMANMQVQSDKQDKDHAIKIAQMQAEIALKREQMLAEIELKREQIHLAAALKEQQPSPNVGHGAEIGGQPG